MEGYITNITNFTNGASILSNQTSAPQSHPYGPLGQYTEFWIASYLNRYYPWVLCSVGVLCNMVVFAITMVTKPFNSSSMYVATLSIVDSLALITKLLYTVLTAHDVPLGQAGCQLIFFVGFFMVQFSVWILAIITLERFVAVQFVFRVSSLFTMSRARLSLVMTALLLIAVDMNVFWTTTEISDPVTGLQCGFHPQHQYFATKVWNWMDAALAFFMPCALLIILNSLIIFKLNRHGANTKACFEGNSDIVSRKRQQNKQLTVMLVTMSVGTTCLLLPIAVFYIVKVNWNYRSTPHSLSVFYLVTNLVHFLADCSHAMNFVFCMLGGSRFREALRRRVCQRGNKWDGKKSTLRTSNFQLSMKSEKISVSHIVTHL